MEFKITKIVNWSNKMDFSSEGSERTDTQMA